MPHTEQNMIKPLFYRHIVLDNVGNEKSVRRLSSLLSRDHTRGSPKISWIHTFYIKSLWSHWISVESNLEEQQYDTVALIVRMGALRELSCLIPLIEKDLTFIASYHGPALTKLNVRLTWKLLPLIQRFPALEDLQILYDNPRGYSELQTVYHYTPMRHPDFAASITLPSLRVLMLSVPLGHFILLDWLKNCNLPMLRKMVFTGKPISLGLDLGSLSIFLLNHGRGLRHFGFGSEYVTRPNYTTDFLPHMPNISTIEICSPISDGFYLDHLPMSVKQIVLRGFNWRLRFGSNLYYAFDSKVLDKMSQAVRKLHPGHSLRSFRVVREYGDNEPWLWEDAMELDTFKGFQVGETFRKPVMDLSQFGVDILDEQGVALADVVKELDSVHDLAACSKCSTHCRDQPLRVIGFEIVENKSCVSFPTSAVALSYPCSLRT